MDNSITLTKLIGHHRNKERRLLLVRSSSATKLQSPAKDDLTKQSRTISCEPYDEAGAEVLARHWNS